jgi:hypothetical protein
LKQRKEIESKEGQAQLLAVAIQEKAETETKSARELEAAHQDLRRHQEVVDMVVGKLKKSQSKIAQLELDAEERKSKIAQLELDAEEQQSKIEE